MFYLACYHVTVGNNYAGGTEERLAMFDHPSQALTLPNLRWLWRIDSHTEMSQDEINAALKEKAIRDEEDARLRRILQLKRELAELESQ